MNAGRILLAFGRDGMIPFPQYWLYIRSGEPVFGILFTICVHLILGLVQLAPAAAFISLLGSSVIFTFTAYCASPLVRIRDVYEWVTGTILVDGMRLN